MSGEAHEWISVKDEKTGLRIDFPHEPLNMTFDVPFQNTPPKGVVRLYSVPTQSGLLVLSIFQSSIKAKELLKKEQFMNFFSKILVPHFFYYPHVFQEQQIFEYQNMKIKELSGGIFQISYLDHEVEKKIEGCCAVDGGIFYIYFYLSSADDFDIEILKRFVNSIEFPESSEKNLEFNQPKEIDN